MSGIGDIDKGYKVGSKTMNEQKNLSGAPSSKGILVDDGDGAVSSDDDKPTELTSKSGA